MLQTTSSSLSPDMVLEIQTSASSAVRELIEVGHLSPGQLLVIGCSSSEMIGERIGKHSSLGAAEALCDAILPILKEQGIFVAAQCCEHLNRALIVERACAERYGYEPVWVRPRPKAGGSFATTVWDRMTDPVAVEAVSAHAGLDIGSTLIGMHLRRVAVPVRLSVKTVGAAPLTAARTRPAYIGGPRAEYQTSEP